MRYIVEKGSVAIDGISLTVAERTDTGFTISLIPHTGEDDIDGQKTRGSVNIECDYIGKYIEQLMKDKPGEGLTLGMLQSLGHGGSYGL